MMFRSWAVVFRIKFVAVQRLLVVLSVLSLLVLGQVPATGRSWQRAKGVAPVLGDYLAFLNASAYQAQQKNQDVITTLADFEQKYPDSLLLHDAGLMHARALTASGAAQRAAAYLEKHRQPVHA